MLHASVVTSLSHAFLSGYFAYALGREAKSRSRKDLATAFLFYTLYGLSIAIGYMSPKPLSSVLFDVCLSAALLGTLFHLRFAEGVLAGADRGGDRGAKRSVSDRITVPVLVVACALLLDGGRRISKGGSSDIDEALLGIVLLLLFLTSIAVLGRRCVAADTSEGKSPLRKLIDPTGDRARALRAYMLASSWPLVPTFINITNNFGWSFAAYRMVLDLCVLAFLYFLILAYIDHGEEPMSLRVRLMAGTLTLSLGIISATCELLVRHPAAKMLGGGDPETYAHAASFRALVLAGVTAMVALGTAPRLYRRSLLEPLDRLMEGMRGLQRGERDLEIPVTCDDEIGFLTRAFNRAVASLSQAESDSATRLEALRGANVEMESLNVELKRQIAARSRELGDALAHANPTGGPLVPGDLVEGRYRVVETLGRGGMGSVYGVERVRDGRRLALKMMHGTTSESAARFAREAEIAAQLDHENLVSVLDVGIWRGAAFLVMEHVSGGSLEDRRPRFGDVGWSLPVLDQMATALVALHARGVVHRDLKPANVLLIEEHGRIVVKIADFGIAMQDEIDVLASTVGGKGATPRLTGTGALMGTLPYMAPELAEGARGAGSAADVFAFGLIAYEIATGRSAFSVPPVFTALSGGVLGEAPPLPPAVPGPLALLLRQCLAARPANRPSARAIAQAFAAAA